MIRLSGRLRSAVIIGIQGIRARKLRTLLSMVSLFLGVLAVVAVQAAAGIEEQSQLANLELQVGKDGTQQLSIPPEGQAIPIALDTLRGHGEAVGTYNVSAIIGEPTVSPINQQGQTLDDAVKNPMAGLGGGPLTQDNASMPRFICTAAGACQKLNDGDTGGRTTIGAAITLNLTAMTGDLRQFLPYRPASGQWLDFTSAPRLAPRIVVNKAAAEGFERYRIPDEMRIPGATANVTPQIIGVIDDGQGAPNAYVRSDELANWLPAMSPSSNALMVWMRPGDTAMAGLLRSKIVNSGVNPSDLNLSVVNARKQIEDALALSHWIFLSMAGLVLLIGVAGILNVGLATVGERVEEFALRRAVGTPRVLLAGIVLSETLLTGLLTSAAAIGVAILGLRLAGHVIGGRFPSLSHVAFPWQAGVAGVIAGLVAGLLGGLFPAIRAARIAIATIMRA
jgi:putative ABC transport system permease protein